MISYNTQSAVYQRVFVLWDRLLVVPMQGTENVFSAAFRGFGKGPYANSSEIMYEDVVQVNKETDPVKVFLAEEMQLSSIHLSLQLRNGKRESFPHQCLKG
jgi:hypothetical protein